MNPAKAIEILEEERKAHHSFSTDIIGQAEALGIEGLKECLRARDGNPALDGELLPGETED